MRRSGDEQPSSHDHGPHEARDAAKPLTQSEERGFTERIAAITTHPLLARHAATLPHYLAATPHAESYLRRIEQALEKHAENGALAAAHVEGVVFELSRIASLRRQGLEQLDFSVGVVGDVTYRGYQAKENDFSEKQRKVKKGTIDPDVPLTRDVTTPDGGTVRRPYIYEAKAYPRMAYGMSAENRNQVLRYQQAIEDGRAAGATIEVQGRIDAEFLEWLMGKSIAERGAAPDVEVLYTLPLPSGAEYRFVLHSGHGRQGLQYTNEHAAYTPEDREVIHGIYRAILDHSIIRILASTEVADASAPLRPLLDDPYQKITTAELFYEYIAGRERTMHGALRQKNAERVINTANERSAAEISGYPDEQQRMIVEHIFDAFQASLHHDPELANMKDRYAVDDAELRTAIVNTAMDMIGKIGSYERERAAMPATIERPGYRGKPEGVALIAENIVFDAVYIVVRRDKGGSVRSYEMPERFTTVTLDNVVEYLRTQDRVYRTCELYDPMTGETEVLVSDGTADADRRIEKRQARLQQEHDARLAQEFANVVQEHTTRREDLEAQSTRSVAEVRELRVLQGEAKTVLREIANLEAAIEKRKTALARTSEQKATLEGERRRASGEARAAIDERLRSLVTDLRSRSEEARTANARDRQAIQERYVKVIGEQRWEARKPRIVSESTRNLLKFIYTVSADGTVNICEEKVRGNNRMRATHSELAGGRNVYGAGEIVFEKQHGEWRAIELNNGSGHYRPSRVTLPYVAYLVGQKIDLTHCAQRDVLLRGVSTSQFSAALPA